MRHNPDYAVDSAGITAMVRQLIREHPWCTLVSHVPGRSPAEGPSMVASHYPVMLEEDVFGTHAGPEGAGSEGARSEHTGSGEEASEDEIVLLSHMGRPDEEKHQLGEHPMLAIIQGPHGYISPGWYEYRPNVPTWNFAAAHLTGTAEILPNAENLAVLEHLRGEGPYADPALAERMERVNADMLAEPSAARASVHQEPPDV